MVASHCSTVIQFLKVSTELSGKVLPELQNMRAKEQHASQAAQEDIQHIHTAVQSLSERMDKLSLALENLTQSLGQQQAAVGQNPFFHKGHSRSVLTLTRNPLVTGGGRSPHRGTGQRTPANHEHNDATVGEKECSSTQSFQSLLIIGRGHTQDGHCFADDASTARTRSSHAVNQA
jgi:hypothetical protein